MRWVTWLGIAVATVLLAVSSGSVTPAFAANDAMSVSLDVAGNKGFGANFVVNVSVDNLDAGNGAVAW